MSSTKALEEAVFRDLHFVKSNSGTGAIGYAVDSWSFQDDKLSNSSSNDDSNNSFQTSIENDDVSNGKNSEPIAVIGLSFKLVVRHRPSMGLYARSRTDVVDLYIRVQGPDMVF